MFGTISTVSALSYSRRAHSFRYDKNTITGGFSIYNNYTYIDVPDSSTLTRHEERIVSYG